MQKSIAVIFDFDDTLAPDSTSGFLESYGIDVTNFWQNEVQPLIENGWDPVPAYLYLLVEKSKSGLNFTKDSFIEFGQNIKFYNGVSRIFNNLRNLVEESAKGVRLEYYLISSGIGEIVRSSSIAKNFDQIWACDFHYNEDKQIDFPKRIVSFTDKTRYLFQLSKGIINEKAYNRPFLVNKKVKNSELRIPFNQMVFVGDGHTDIPCFSLMREKGGVSFGVYDPMNQDKLGKAWGFVEDERVSNLLPTDYGQNSALSHSLRMAISSIADKIKIGDSVYKG